MRKTAEKKELKFENCLALNSRQLAEALNCGLQTAVKIGTDAKARIQVGRRVLYSVPKVKEYLDEIAAK